MDNTKMVTKKSWKEFRGTGLLLIINQILHIFGWAIVFNIDNDKITEVFPARVKFRGFDNDTVSKSYLALSKFINKNSKVLLDEASR